MSNPLQPFEPEHVIRLVYAQYPHRTDVLRALQLCSTGYWETEKYICFIHAKQNTESKIVESLVVDDEQQGRIVVDVVADGRIARIAYASAADR
jgi:hypothetical protein